MKKFDYFVGAVAIFAFFLLIAELSSYFDRFGLAIWSINYAILFLFIVDVLLKFFLSKDKKEHLKRHWFDLIVFLPLLQFVAGLAQFHFFVIIWQLVIVTMAVSRVKRANKFITLLSLKPAQLMIVGFSFAIGVGTILLMLPIATRSGSRTSLLDALFTATSATCVTGLIVKDTATYFSLFGQLVILGLIQIGGLGIMTFSVSLALLLKKRVEMQRQIVMKEVLDYDTATSVKENLIFIVKMTFLLEAAGALALLAAWKDRFANIFSAAYCSLFHSVSAFCNAGFSTFSDSLMRFSRDLWINLTICALIVSGGIGFTVIRDIYDSIREGLSKKSWRSFRFRVQTKIALTTSAVLIVLGACALYFLERHHSFAAMGVKESVLCSLFQSISARTAGFNTCDMAGLSSASLLVLMVLMFIGGSPGSTAGGIKTTTAAIIWAAMVSGFKQRQYTELYKRTIPAEVIQKAVSVLVISLGLITLACAMLLYVDKKLFIDMVFEATSAFGTVGLSVGITPQLSGKAKSIITLLMFIGRLGPLTIGYAFVTYQKPCRYQYAQERVMVG